MLNGYDQSTPGVIHKAKYEEVCYGYDQILAFPVVQTLQTTPDAAALVSDEVVNYDPEEEPVPVQEMSPVLVPLAVCLAVLLILV